MRGLLFIITTILLLILLLVNSFYDKKKYNYRIALVIAFLSIVFHFYIYSMLGDETNISLLVSSVRSVSATLKLFGGYTLISDADFVKVFHQNAYFAMLFYYLLHILAYAMTLSVLVVAIGKKYIYVIWRFFALIKLEREYYIFYKYNDNAAILIDKMCKEQEQPKQTKQHIKKRIVILDKDLYEHIEDKFNDLVWKKHCIVLSENLDNKYINKIIGNAKNRDVHIKLFVVSNKNDENYKFANEFCEKVSEIKKHNEISLTIISDEYYNFDDMQKENRFSYIRNFNNIDIISRVLIENHPPCNYVDFKDCKAKDNESFNCLIIGFGEMGQKIFERLFIYGQFVNCKFNCTIIDDKFKDVCAGFKSKFDFVLNKKICEQYSFITKNVSINTDNKFSARSEQFYEYLKENANKLDYIVVSTGSEKTNNEIAKNLLKMRSKFDNAQFDVFDCTKDRIYSYNMNYESKKADSRNSFEIFDYILDDDIDNAGKLVNYAYCAKNIENISDIDIDNNETLNDIKEYWNECSAYGKKSSISAAAFYKTILKVIGIKKENDKYDYEKALKYIECLPQDKKNYLGEMEHNRWSAFMLTEGYRYMDYDKNNKKSKYHDKKLHACLVPYDKLVDLDMMEEDATGNNPNYKEKDIKNVIMAIRIAELINKK